MILAENGSTMKFSIAQIAELEKSFYLWDSFHVQFTDNCNVDRILNQDLFNAFFLASERSTVAG